MAVRDRVIMTIATRARAVRRRRIQHGPLGLDNVDGAVIVCMPLSARNGIDETVIAAAYPSGPRGRIANPLCVGSNPTAAFSRIFEFHFFLGSEAPHAEIPAPFCGIGRSVGEG